MHVVNTLTGGIVAATITESISERGFAFLPGYSIGASLEETARALGTVAKLAAGGPFSTLIPTTKDASTPNTYSGIYGLGTFPFHTDLAHWRRPPRFLMLRCVVGFREVPTLLVDGFRVASEVGQELLGRALVRPRRPVNGSLPLLRILQSSNAGSLIRWDEVFFCSASDVGTQGVDQFRNELSRTPSFAVSLEAAGDTLIVDNWRMLHARSPVPAGFERRIIERAYLETLN